MELKKKSRSVSNTFNQSQSEVLFSHCDGLVDDSVRSFGILLKEDSSNGVI